MFSWLGHVLGLDSANGPYYLWWSGAGADLGMLAAAGSVVRKLNCDRRGCWKVGRFHHGDRAYCRRHHPHDTPDGPATAS